MAEEVRVALELGATTPAFRSVFGTNVGIGSQGLVMAGTHEQKAEGLPKIARGEIITSFPLTQPRSEEGRVGKKGRSPGAPYHLKKKKQTVLAHPALAR